MQCLTSSQAKRAWRQAIKDAWRNSCCYCGGTHELTLDHIRPRCRGGQDALTNLAACCLEHNQDKGSTDWILWFRHQHFYDPTREMRIHYWMANGLLVEDSEIRVWLASQQSPLSGHRALLLAMGT